MTAITKGSTTVNPVLWMDYKSDRDSRTTTHDLIGGGTSVHVAPAGPRRVQLALLFDLEAASKQCEDMHATPGTFTITEPGRTTHSMKYIVAGTVSRALNPETASVWIVTVEAMEIP